MTENSGSTSDVRRLARHVAPKQAGRVSKGVFQTLPIILVSSMAMSLNLTGPIEPAGAKRADKPKDSNSELRKAVRDAMAAQPKDTTVAASAAAVAAAPTTYRVAAGDTVSGIAARFGLATASVLALNGLGWKSLIFPGQVLRLTSGAAPPAAAPPASTPPASTGITRYTIMKGDTISAIAARFKVSTQSVLSANGLGWSSIIYPGQSVVIPGQPAATKPAPAPTTPDAGTIDIDPVVDVTPIAQPTPPPAPASTTYLIRSGDTITSIAAKFGVSIQSLLDANGLTRSSIIYAGRTLVIPGVSSGTAGVGGVVTPLTAEMAENARIILSVGRSLGVSDYALVIALAAAAQESTLRNLDYGDRDSLGLFQQRPSTGWGTPAQVTDPVYASRLFFGGPSNPNKGNTRGLLDIPGWQSMTVTQAAQAVQRSAYPNAYAKWETSARAWLAQLS
ncbi:MAG TPA: LysM peptidoglycan-binding domain-containing protein [Terrimesophilobacter sp.]|nr:LysM peptidoglycan-binding domain-containing protein [Terrimesophilobacter sp.]